MKLADIQSRTWYALRETYMTPPLVLVLGSRRFTRGIEWRERARVAVLKETPDRKPTKGRYGDGATGVLAIHVVSSAAIKVRDWVLEGEQEDQRPEVLGNAERLLDELMVSFEAGTTDWADLVRIVSNAGPFELMIAQPRNITGLWVNQVLIRHEVEQRRAKEEVERKERQAREDRFNLETKELAKSLGLGGKAYATGGYGGAQFSMSAQHYRDLLEEIKRLRELNAATLRADEIGEGEPCG